MGDALKVRALLPAALLFVLAAPAAAETDCAAPAALTRLEAPLPRTAARIRAGEPLRIVAIGSSSTAGFGASAPGKAYPPLLAAELRRRLPGQKVEVLNRGIGGEEAGDMVRRLDQDVLRAGADLAIWQLGTNSVTREHDLVRFEQVVRGGLERIRRAGIDLLLMDLQYAPKVTVHPQHLEMERRIDALAAEGAVPVFHRFALMRHWIASGQLTLRRMLSPDELHLNDLSYRCLALGLAEAIVAATTRGESAPLTSRR
jgi:lysophospholipase L1-like esterase